MTHHPFLDVFLRIDNRKKTWTFKDVLHAGYPMVECDMRSGKWKELHQLCQEQFKDGTGRQTYIWFGHRFFFLNKEDANLFKTLQLIA